MRSFLLNLFAVIGLLTFAGTAYAECPAAPGYVVVESPTVSPGTVTFSLSNNNAIYQIILLGLSNGGSITNIVLGGGGAVSSDSEFVIDANTCNLSVTISYSSSTSNTLTIEAPLVDSGGPTIGSLAIPASAVAPAPTPTPNPGPVYYQIQNAETGDCMDVTNYGTFQYFVMAESCGNFSGQFWLLTSKKNGYLTLQTPFYTGFDNCLDTAVNDRFYFDNQIDIPAQFKVCANHTGMNWIFTSQGAGYAISNLYLGNDACLTEVAQSSQFPFNGKNGNVDFRPCNGSSSQTWVVTPQH